MQKYTPPEPGTLRHQVESGLRDMVEDGFLNANRFKEICLEMNDRGIGGKLREELGRLFERDAEFAGQRGSQIASEQADISRQIAQVDAELGSDANQAEEWGIANEAKSGMDDAVSKTRTAFQPFEDFLAATDKKSDLNEYDRIKEELMRKQSQKEQPFSPQ